MDDAWGEHARAALRDRTHRELGLERHAELAHHDDVQPRAQRSRDLVRDRDATTGQPDDDRGAVAQVPQVCGQLTPRRATVAEPAAGTSLGRLDTAHRDTASMRSTASRARDAVGSGTITRSTSSRRDRYSFPSVIDFM